MKVFSFCLFVLLLLSIPLMGAPVFKEADMTSGNNYPESCNGPIWDGPKDVLFNNGPVINSFGTGVGGADESRVDIIEIDLAWGCQVQFDIRLADDFTVPSGEIWSITDIVLFGLQSYSGTTPTITEVYVEIFDDHPGIGNSVWGDLGGTNIFSSAEWTGAYRVRWSQSGTNSTKPIMAAECNLGSPIMLNPGDYWIVWQMAGSMSEGPWCPPVTITGQLITGNAIQYYDDTDAGEWFDIFDEYTSYTKGLPFILEGNNGTALDRATWAGIKSCF